jgi:hypothetical protein
LTQVNETRGFRAATIDNAQEILNAGPWCENRTTPAGLWRLDNRQEMAGVWPRAFLNTKSG